MAFRANRRFSSKAAVLTRSAARQLKSVVPVPRTREQTRPSLPGTERRCHSRISTSAPLPFPRPRWNGPATTQSPPIQILERLGAKVVLTTPEPPEPTFSHPPHRERVRQRGPRPRCAIRCPASRRRCRVCPSERSAHTPRRTSSMFSCGHRPRSISRRGRSSSGGRSLDNHHRPILDDARGDQCEGPETG